MTYPQAIFGGFVVLALSAAAIGLATHGNAQSPANYFAVAPMDKVPSIVVVNASSGAVRYCSVDDKERVIFCGQWVN